MRLSASLRTALEVLDSMEWRGVYEGGPAGTTILALESRGLADAAWSDRPYRHLVGRLTQKGLDERAARAAAKFDPDSDRDVIEGVLRNAEGVSGEARLAAVEALERLYARARLAFRQ